MTSLLHLLFANVCPNLPDVRINPTLPVMSWTQHFIQGEDRTHDPFDFRLDIIFSISALSLANSNAATVPATPGPETHVTDHSK